MENKEKTSWKEAISLHLWAAKVWWKIEPKLFLSFGLFSFLTAGSPYVTIWLSAQIVGELAGARDPAALWRWVILTVAVTALLKLAQEAAYHWKEAVHAPEYELENRLQFEKLMDMDYCSVEDKETDRLLYAINKHQRGNWGGFTKIHTWYIDRMVQGFVSIVGAIALTASMFSQRVPESAGALTILNHPLMSAGLLVVLVVGALLSPWFSAKTSGCHEKLWPHINRYYLAQSAFGYPCELPEDAPDIRIYNQQTLVREAMEAAFPWGKGSPAWNVVFREKGVYDTLSTVASTLLIGVVYVFVCLKAWAGAFGVGAITQYVGAITKLCGGISDLFAALGDMPGNAVYMRAIRDYMEIPNPMYQGSLTTEKRSDRKYDVEFKDVSFQYPGTDRWVLRHVNMKFRIGSRMAVVGRNGSGKTTFIKLLCRLYDPTEGEILLNGINIRKYRYDDYLNLFSVVFQDFRLLELPLGENVAASAHYDREKVLDCLEKAGFGERLKTMPKGLDTYLYKNLDKEGVEVSGGEAQKIAIARALYKNAPFIILDEPTAALDPIAEAEIYSKFNDIVGDKTAIYISHRLSSCRFCDEILVFHEGSIVQQGSHESLVADEEGNYHALWQAQAQYYVEE